MSTDVALSSLADINPRRGVVNAVDDDPVTFIPMTDVSESGRWVHRQTRPYREVRSGYTCFNNGDVLFAKITPCTENGKGCHPTDLVGSVGFASTEFHVLRAKDDADAGFVFQWSIDLSLRRKASAMMTGSAGQQRVPASFFSTFSVPRIPKPEQSKISEVLSMVDSAIAETEALIAKQQRIKFGLMQDLLTRGIDDHGQVRSEATHAFKDSPLGRIPVEWEVNLLDAIAERGSGHTPSKQRPEYWNGGIKWISLADSSALDQLHINETEYEISDLGIRNSSAVLHPPGTVVLSRDAGVGKSAVMQSNMAVSQHFMAWRCGKRLHNYFLYYWLQHDKPRFEGIASGSTIVTIGLQFFKKYLIAHPIDPEEQISIAKVLLKSEETARRFGEKLVKLRHLKTALMQDLLTGKVRVTPLLQQAEEATA